MKDSNEKSRESAVRVKKILWNYRTERAPPLSF